MNSQTDSFREREQERTVDAQASGGEEGRGKLRKAPGICKQELIRRCPNGETRQVEDLTLTQSERTWGTETSQYPQEEKEISIPKVVAIEMGRA